MPSDRPPPLALTYHGVAALPLREDPEGLFVSARALERHLRTLRRWGYRLVSFGELAALAASGEAAGHASLTFDDGLADNLNVLQPLLERAGATATVFVTTGWLGEPHPTPPHAPMLTASEVRELSRLGLEIGGHTHTHPDLTRVDPGDAQLELARGRELLEDLLQQPVRTAAYPFGHASDAVRAACARAGFQAACRTCGEGNWSDPFDLPRQAMTNRATTAGLWLKRDNRYERLVSEGPLRVARGLRRRTLRLLG